MSRKLALLGFFSVMVNIAGCAGKSVKASSDLNLSVLDKAHWPPSSLIQNLGTPNYEIDDNGTKVLIFCEEQPCRAERLIFRLTGTSKAIKSAVWIPKSTDSEYSLSSVLNHYKGAQFTKKRLQFDYGHYFQFSDQYSNRDLGIVISYDPERKYVTQIGRGEPGMEIPVTASRGRFPIISILPDRETASKDR